MRRTARSVVVRAMAVCVLATAALAGSTAAYAHNPTPSQAAFEIEFMKETIDHHFAGVKMAELCLEKGTSKKLRGVCSDIAVGQSEEIEVMQRWLDKWYDVEKEPELMPADEQMLTDLAALEGREFDVAVSTAFIEHHRVQISRSQVCLEEAVHRELIKLCKQQIETQSREIRIFEKVVAASRGNGHGDKGKHGHAHGGRQHGHDHGGHHERDDDDRGDRRETEREDDD